MAFWAIALVGISATAARGAALPTGWQNKDMGAVTRKGSTDYDPAKGVWTVTGEGSDIWGANTDNFQFAYTQLKGDGNVTGRILSQTGGHDDGWGRNGLMIREDLDADARHLDFVLGVQPADPRANSQGVFYSYRRPDKGSDQMTWNQTLGNNPYYNQEARNGSVGIRELPMWVRIQRQGNFITAYISPDGKVWSSQIVPQTLGNTPLPDSMFVGLAVCGHNPDDTTGTLSTTVFDNVSVSNDVLAAGPSDAQATPSHSDNSVLVTWTGRPTATAYTIYRQAQGEQQFTKAGTADNVTWFIDSDSAVKAGTNYRYVVTATIGGKETAGSYPALVASGAIPSPIGSFVSYDIGTGYPGSTKLDNGVLTIQASGHDIWDASDGMRFVGTEVRGNLSMTAQILARPTSANPDGWVKAGLMVRESLDPASRNGMMVVSSANSSDRNSPDAGSNFQFRRHFSNTADDSLGAQEGMTVADSKFPHWIRITRNRDKIEGFESNDGTTFTKVGGDDGGVTLDRLAARVYVGFAVTNHRDGDIATAKFDANSVTFQ
jgi:hypothetical protein